jgi:hypothetical protein
LSVFSGWLIRIYGTLKKYFKNHEKVLGTDLWHGYFLIKIFTKIIIHLHAVVRLFLKADGVCASSM